MARSALRTRAEKSVGSSAWAACGCRWASVTLSLSSNKIPCLHLSSGINYSLLRLLRPCYHSSPSPNCACLKQRKPSALLLRATEPSGRPVCSHLGRFRLFYFEFWCRFEPLLVALGPTGEERAQPRSCPLRRSSPPFLEANPPHTGPSDGQSCCQQIASPKQRERSLLAAAHALVSSPVQHRRTHGGVWAQPLGAFAVGNWEPPAE